MFDARFAAQRTEAIDQGDFHALAESYAQENDDLRRLREDLTAENRALQDNINSLLKYRSDVIFDDSGLGAAREAPPETAREAVYHAKEKFGSLLVFSDDLDDQIASLRADAGPPDSILNHLQGLSLLAAELKSRRGRIGDSQVAWLKARGFNCSGESETKKGSGLYRFSVNGSWEQYELHLKVNDAVAPDRCVRIYFRHAEDFSRVNVGFVGSKKLL
jgi:hypothetical protein